MENKTKRTGRLLLPVLFLLISILSLNAQNISKAYVVSPQENGSLYFIYSQGDFKNKSDGNEMKYDITYLDSNDSITLNFTYADKTTLAIDSITFSSARETITLPTYKLFIEYKKNKWEYRYGVKVPFEQMHRFFLSENSPKIQLICEEHPPFVFAIKEGDWKKQSQTVSKIFDLINFNK